MKYEIAKMTRVGNRTNNQDACRYEETENGILIVVADGLGGIPRGELASQTVVESICESFIAYPSKIKNPRDFLMDVLANAHSQVLAAGFREEPPVRPCTTCVVCLIRGNSAWWVHVGDSRLYLVRDGKVVFRSRDHSPVEDLHRQGIITNEEMRFHPKRNYITRCLGGVAECPQIEYGCQSQLRNGDVILACSDGLWSQLDEKIIVEKVSVLGVEAGLDLLGAAAEESGAGHSDNITAIALKWLEQQTASTKYQERPVITADDPDLEDAIDLINDAIKQYKDEMKSS